MLACVDVLERVDRVWVTGSCIARQYLLSSLPPTTHENNIHENNYFVRMERDLLQAASLLRGSQGFSVSDKMEVRLHSPPTDRVPFDISIVSHPIINWLYPSHVMMMPQRTLMRGGTAALALPSPHSL